MWLEIFFFIQLIASAAMTGIIWIVQVAIYPLFARLKGAVFDDYHNRYMKRVTFVIAPIMFLEATSCAACLLLGEWHEFILPALLLGIVWGSTALIQVPQHQRLTPNTVSKLVLSNWIRTAAWTTRTAILFAYLI